MYILERQAQRELKEHLRLVETKDAGWTKIYLDPVSSQRWIEYYPFSEYHGGGQPYLRHEEIPKDIKTLLDTCLCSDKLDDAIGVGTDLSNQTEQWLTIIVHIEKNQNKYSLANIQLFIQSLGILNVINRDSTTGKTYSDIQKDWNKWIELSERAKMLIKKQLQHPTNTFTRNGYSAAALPPSGDI